MPTLLNNQQVGELGLQLMTKVMTWASHLMATSLNNRDFSPNCDLTLRATYTCKASACEKEKQVLLQHYMKKHFRALQPNANVHSLHFKYWSLKETVDLT